MSLINDGNIDLLDLANKRELNDYIPWHFTRVTLDTSIPVNRAKNWIRKNLDGRFAFANMIDHEQRYFNRTVIGFEEPYEASAFMLSAPLIQGSPDDPF